MISQKLVDLIRSNTAKLGEQWAKEVKDSEHMKTYQRLATIELSRRNQRFFENLVVWLEKGALYSDITKYFSRVGRERYAEGIPLDEINYGIIIAKRVLWHLILSEGIFTRAHEVFQALELITVVYNFFDFGFYYIGKEYLDEMHTRLTGIKGGADICPRCTGPTDKELEKLFGIKFSMK